MTTKPRITNEKIGRKKDREAAISRNAIAAAHRADRKRKGKS